MGKKRKICEKKTMKNEKITLGNAEIQNKYLQLLNTKNITFAIGPAGTGKTYLAVAKAVSALQDGKVNKIIFRKIKICRWFYHIISRT